MASSFASIRRPGRTLALTILALALALAAVPLSSAFADPAWAESGDADNLPATAQKPQGTGPLTTITGSLTAYADEDMFQVCLDGNKTFSASTVGGATFDTQLFLFDSSGRGVYANDDASGTSQSTLPAGHARTPTAEGTYYLAVSKYDNDPVSSGGAIFPSLPHTGIFGPTGAGGGSPVSNWNNRSSIGSTYRISLTGAKFCGTATSLGVADVSVDEGTASAAVFLVQLSSPASSAVSFDYSTVDGTAVAGQDYEATAGSASIPAGTTSMTVPVPVVSDPRFETNETFALRLSNVTNASLGDGEAVATIVNDDPRPSVSVLDVDVLEGDTGSRNVAVKLVLSNPSYQTVKVDVASADETAVSPSDYAPLTTTAMFAPDETETTVEVAVKGDVFDEPDESFSVNVLDVVHGVSGDGAGVVTIRDDDSPIGCLPRGLGFWRKQFNSETSDNHFTVSESKMLLRYAVELSQGYFENGDSLLTALRSRGDDDRLRAVRHYAALLLNLAAGDGSAKMGFQAGLSGAELLSPDVYDVPSVGPTVDDAAAWVGNKVVAGEWADAQVVSENLNEGNGLSC